MRLVLALCLLLWSCPKWLLVNTADQVEHLKQVLEKHYVPHVILQNNKPNLTTVAGRELVKMNLIHCKNTKCDKEYNSEIINDIDPSPEFDYCSNTCYQIGMKQIKYAKDKRKTLHVKPDTYEIYLKAKTKLSNKFNLESIGETDNDDRVLFSIFAHFLLEDI